MIRKANENDISRVAEIYDKIIDNDKGETSRVGWIKGVYPTAETAGAALEKDELFVLEEDGAVFGAAIINKTQPPAYAKAHWNYTDAADDRIMVLHTLVIDPETKGRGFGTKFVDFYENYAREDGCLYLRIDTNETNTAARRLYAHLGYNEIGIIAGVFNGIPDVRLVCMEKKL